MYLSGKPHVMVVDDDPGMCAFLETFLAERGYHAITLGNAQDAVQRYQDDRPAAPAGMEQPLAHGLRRADVEAPRRVGGDDQLRLARQLAGEDQLLEVAAGEGPGRDVRP